MDGVRSVTQLHHSLRHRSCKKEIENGFKEFVETYGRKPELAEPNFWLAAGETFGMNVSLWAFNRYILKGHYDFI